MIMVCLQVNTDLEPEVASDDSAAELSGLLQDPHFMVQDFFKSINIFRIYQVTEDLARTHQLNAFHEMTAATLWCLFEF